jgi:hypothetical protein
LEDELDCGTGAGASVNDCPHAGWQSERRPARKYATAGQAKDILLWRNWFLGLRSFIDSQGHKQPNNNVMLIQAAAL